MRFKVTGADRTTGELTTRTIEGKSAVEAEAVASFTMLVSEVTSEEASPPQTVPYAVPVARERVAGVNWARGIGFYTAVLRWLGWGVGAAGVWVVLTALWAAFRSLLFGLSLLYVLTENDAALLLGLLLISAAVFMHVIALVAIAVRDMAICLNQIADRPKEPQN